MYATDSMPSCDICLPASVGRRVQSTFNIINAADFDVTTRAIQVRPFFPPLSVTVSLCLPSPFLYGDLWGYPLLSGIRLPPHPPLLLSRGWLGFRGHDCNPHLAIPSLSEYQPQAHDCAASSSMQFEDVDDEESEERSPHNPFEHIPALRNFRLSGARVTLSRSKNTRVPSEQTLQLWAHTRGLMEGGNWRGVRANKITSLYTADSQAAAFAAQSRPSVFPLNESAAKRDDFWHHSRRGSALPPTPSVRP